MSAAVLDIFAVNTPQVVFSLLYLFYNGLFTSLFAAHEWSRFAYKHRPLRVTTPRGPHQRSTYYLQMPLRFGISFALLSMFFHFLISESTYFSRLAVYDIIDVHTPRNDFSTTGSSLPPIVLILICGSMVLCLGIVIGFAQFRAGIPVVGGCSAAISATCHPLQDDPDAALVPLKWGAVCEPMDLVETYRSGVRAESDQTKEEGAIGHCAFSAGEVSFPLDGYLYM